MLTNNKSSCPQGLDRSSGLITKCHSSLLAATKRVPKSVKGIFADTTLEPDQPDGIEGARGRSERDKLQVVVMSWSDADVGQDHQAMSNAWPDLPRIVIMSVVLLGCPWYKLLFGYIVCFGGKVSL